MADYAIHDTTLTGIANTIRKKDGTQALIDPAEYADRINLMGMLEEKTISGAVASCSDGADAVPLSSWTIDVNPTLTGKSQIIATQGKKNLLAKEIVRYTNAMAELSECFAIHHGTYTVTIGTVENANNWRLSVLLMDSEGNALTDNTYKPSNDLQLATNRWRYGSNTTTKSFTINIVVDCYVRFFIELGDTSSSTTISNSFLEVGSSATSYEPYSAPVDKTVSLGQTIYGGEADVVNGTGKGNIKVVTVNENSNLVMYSSAYIKPTSCDVVLVDNDIYPRKGETNQPDGLVGNYLSFIKTNIWNADGHPDCFAINQNQIHMNFENSRIGVTDYTQETTASVIAKVKAYLQNHPFVCTVPVAETDFTFTPITPTPETALGVNNFWGDSGDSEVTYRSSGTVTPIVPVLTTKSITENGTYSAEDDDADGYSQVTVNVPQGSTIPFEKVWSSGDTGAETFTCTEAGKYLFMVGTSARGTATITSSVTADFTASKQGSDGRGLVIAVYTLAVGDTVTMTNTIVDWVYRVKTVFKTSLSVSATVDSAIVTDGVLSSFSPTFTGNALFVYMAGGRTDNDSYDRTYSTDNFEWASKSGTQTFIRLSYGSNTPTPNMRGYDGGCALAICLQ